MELERIIIHGIEAIVLRVEALPGETKKARLNSTNKTISSDTAYDPKAIDAVAEIGSNVFDRNFSELYNQYNGKYAWILPAAQCSSSTLNHRIFITPVLSKETSAIFLKGLKIIYNDCVPCLVLIGDQNENQYLQRIGSLEQ